MIEVAEFPTRPHAEAGNRQRGRRPIARAIDPQPREVDACIDREPQRALCRPLSSINQLLSVRTEFRHRDAVERGFVEHAFDGGDHDRVGCYGLTQHAVPLSGMVSPADGDAP